MSRTRELAIGAFTGVIVLLLALIVWVEFNNSSQTVLVWKMTKTVNPGTQYTADYVAQVPVKGEAGDFAYTMHAPSTSWVFSHGMTAGDIVRDDDLVQSASVSSIPITPGETIDLTGVNNIDVWVLFTTGVDNAPCVELLGRNVPVVSSTGGVINIQVPKTQEAAWLTLTNATDNKLLVATSNGSLNSQAPGVGTCLSVKDAITALVNSVTGNS